jgi:hypothetical protein
VNLNVRLPVKVKFRFPVGSATLLLYDPSSYLKLTAIWNRRSTKMQRG